MLPFRMLLMNINSIFKDAMKFRLLYLYNVCAKARFNHYKFRYYQILRGEFRH